MKKHILVALIVSLVLLGAVGSVSADDPVLQGVNIGPNVIEPQGTCPDSYICNLGGIAHYVRNDNVNGRAILGWHNNIAGTVPGIWGYSSSASTGSVAIEGTSGPTNPGPNATGVRGISNGTGGTGIGVHGYQNGSGWGVFGSTPRGIGVYGNTGSGTGTYGASSTGTGAFGYHSSTTGTAAGVYGYSRSEQAGAPGVLGIIVSNTPGGGSVGVRGINNGTSGAGIGVYGSQAGSGYGVLGYAPRGLGVFGQSSTSHGVFGYHTAVSGTAAGVWGYSRSTSSGARGVLGEIGSTAPGGNSAGVRGINYGTGSLGIGGWFSQNGSGWGVLGSTPSGLGVYGSSGTGTGVYGRSNSAYGVYGLASSSTGTGVLGYHSATNGTTPGVLGYTRSAQQYAYAIFGRALATSPGANVTGVRGHSDGTGSTGIGVWGSHYGSGWGVFGQTATTTSGYAGYFYGRVRVIGNLSASSKTFKIDHPLDPANKFLQHSVVESPDMKNVYDGTVVLDENGQAWVTLPDYFQALNSDFRYQLTAIGAPAPRLFIASEISGNRFQISGGRAGQKVSWQVTGIRQDAYAKAHRVEVEVEKSEEEKGFYLAPELFGASPDKNLTWRLQGALQAPDLEGFAIEPAVDMANEAIVGETAELPDLSANMQLIEKTAEEMYPLPVLEQEPTTSLVVDAP